ncbi:MAG: hypothetical protein A2X13_02245 [Bacteroidetes bacterium GWC2_33_15]|nr:MAG: hypothetical protein A2X10_07380 [Bacteroidetes bacterium GWA2_33_15]OFX52295.1 MAG: hypothetical protein A2X13_02245 [Bacteroidetes bacterium GWC2_33_15]OFX64449.1 MAG: hypothetical protein A2X15_13065 [Bacteroidetes bacterium GWB2_32_14]OFX67854.1 MAG: hypothetical protein A2X14_06890 [Bacteroidetes bacterium GWD2_33_33]HAN19473.1 hypothetical protein [Bacteroidales bacterium]
MKRYKILYIDDQETNLLLFTEVFQYDYFIITAFSGFEALKIIEKQDFDLIISDQAMPQMSGVEFFEHLLKIKPGPNRILLTAFNNIIALEEAVNRAKIFRYVKKPWTREELKPIIDSAIQDYVLRQKNIELTNKLRLQTIKLKESINTKNEILVELEESKDELEKNERKLRKIIDLSPIPIGISNKETIITDLNHQFTRVFGYTLKDVPTINDWYLRAYPNKEMRNNYIKQWNERIAKIFKTNLPIEPLETIVTCKDGKEKVIQLHASAIGENMVVIFNDITEIRLLEENISYRIMMEEETLKAKLAAEAANKAKSEFIANMSHEIRTPMNAILGYAEVLINEISNTAQVNYVRSIQASGKTLLGLINDILDFSKIEAGKIEMKKEPVNLRFVVQEIADIFKFKIKEKSIEFITNVDPGLPTYLLLDELRIKQILLNLVSNALKFTHQGFIKVSVTYKTVNKDTINLTIQIEDSGIGIDKDQQQRIFNVFEQIEGDNDRKYEGSGLGLAISKKLIQLFNGEIDVVSEKGKGSTFIVRLKNIEISTSQGLTEKNKILQHEVYQFKKANILVVDDIDSNRQVISLYLKKLNFNVFEAPDGNKAIELIEKSKPCLILMDLLMPNLDGFETFKKIQQNPEWEDIPVIAITAYNLNNEREQVMNIGFAGYLTKPIDYRELKSILKTFLSANYNESGEIDNLDLDIYNEIKINNIDELIVDINNNIIPIVNQLQKIRPKKLVNELGFSLDILGKKHKLDAIAAIGNELLSASKSFNVEKEKQLINDLGKILDKLKTLKK